MRLVDDDILPASEVEGVLDLVETPLGLQTNDKLLEE